MSTDPTGWPRAPWSSVVPGDRVLAADGQVWECTARDGMRLRIERPGRPPVARRAPGGEVPMHRGEHGRAVILAARAFLAGGLTVEVIG